MCPDLLRSYPMLADAFEAQRDIYLKDQQEHAQAVAIEQPHAAAPKAKLDLATQDLSLGDLYRIRDFGAYDAAGYLAAGLIEKAETWTRRADYSDAQSLWQLVYTFARARKQNLAFALILHVGGPAIVSGYLRLVHEQNKDIVRDTRKGSDVRLVLRQNYLDGVLGLRT